MLSYGIAVQAVELYRDRAIRVEADRIGPHLLRAEQHRDGPIRQMGSPPAQAESVGGIRMRVNRVNLLATAFYEQMR